MKFRLLAYVVYLAILLSLLTIGSVSKTIEVSFIEEAQAQEVEKTIDSEIDRLSIKYGVASSTARAIITCESQMYGSAVNYNRLKDGSIWSEDRGPFQINDYFHKDTMTKLGLDYYNQYDSLEYGFILLSSQGVGPWKASRACWIKLI